MPRTPSPTPKWKKAPPELIAAFDAALPADARVERRTMFGYPCAFVGRNMFAGTHEHRLLVRLGETGREALLAQPGAQRFEPMPGRVMREYVVVPSDVVADRRQLAAWLRKAFVYAAALPVKKKARRTSMRVRGGGPRRAADRTRHTGSALPRPRRPWSALACSTMRPVRRSSQLTRR